MKRVTVKNLQNVKTHGGDFATQELAETWASANRLYFGVDEHEAMIHPNYYDANGSIVVPAEYETVPANFTIEITDVTQEYAERAALALAKKRREAGEAITDKVFAINMSKNLSPQAFQALLQNTTLQAVERLLRSGSLTTAKSLIQGMDETYYTTNEKLAILNAIDVALGES